MPQFNIDMNVLNHLGLSLYTNTPAVLTEIVSNAWDADATEVHIDIDTENSTITISDNGHGMDSADITTKFLKVGYARRRDNREKTPSLKRNVMGRKGIGKLAMFSLANEVSIFTKVKAKDDIVAFKVNVSDLKKAIENNQTYDTQAIADTSCFSKENGTMILLSNIDRKINTTATYLKKHLARRFSILGNKNNFKVFVNNEEITLEHRGYTSKIEFLWSFGQSAQYLKGSERKYKELTDEIEFRGNTYKVSGFIASVTKPSELKDDEVSNNAITILSNGRIFQENILNELDNAKHFTSYLVGEINADFLDLTDHQDMAISSRQGLLQNDERYLILKNFLAKALKEVDKDWDEWRREEGLQNIKDKHPVLIEWLNGLSDKRDKKAAEKLLSSVNTMSFSGSDEEQEETRKDVLKHTVLAFEKLKVRGNLDRLSELSSFNVDVFKPILKSIDDIEESYFYDVTKQRLGIIENFEKLTDDNEKEKVIQKYLYQHLWLLDPSWERTTAETEIERTLTQELKEIEPESTGARIDIAYKTISGKYIIIEMKRPDVKTPFDDLISQGKKYIKATHQWYRNNPNQMQNGKAPIIEVYFIIGTRGQEKVNEEIEFNAEYLGTNYIVDQLRSIHGRIFTYSDLITQSRQTYSEYINSQKDIQRIKELVDSI